MGLSPCPLKRRLKDTMDLRAFQSEDRKSFKPPFLPPWLLSRMRILLKRWTTQFLGFEAGLEDDEPEPGVLEEIEDLGV